MNSLRIIKNHIGHLADRLSAIGLVWFREVEMVCGDIMALFSSVVLLRMRYAACCGLLLAFVGALAWMSPLGAAGAHGKRVVGVTLEPLARLTTHMGEALQLSQLRGRPFVVAFGYTSCADVCPTTLLELSNDLALLGKDGDRITVLFLTVDPDTDTPEHLRAYLTSFDGRIVGLSGNAIDIESAAHAFNAAYERIPAAGGRYTIDHTTRSYYFDKYGLLAGRHDVLKEPAKARLQMINRLLAQ